jgi:hypothetical protein
MSAVVVHDLTKRLGGRAAVGGLDLDGELEREAAIQARTRAAG